MAKKKAEVVEVAFPERENTVQHSDLVKFIISSLDGEMPRIPKAAVKRVLELYHMAITYYLTDKETTRIVLPEGTFRFTRVKQREGYNCVTKKKQVFPETEKLTFRVCGRLKNLVRARPR